MRILIITNLHPSVYRPHRGQANRQMLQALSRHHDVKVVVPVSWVDATRSRQQHDLTRPWFTAPQADEYEVLYPRFYYTPRMLRSQYGRMMDRSIRSCIRDLTAHFHPQVVLGSWAYPDGYTAVKVAQRLGVAAAVQVLGSDINLLKDYPARSRQTLRTLRSAARVITVSGDLARQVIGLGVDASRIHVVYRGINRDSFCPGSQQQARIKLGINRRNPMLLFIGNLVPVKAVDVLISACGRLADRLPEATCHIIGDGPLRAHLQCQAAESPAASMIRFEGSVEHHKLPDWYRAADLVVLPSLAEGVPNVLLESIACQRHYVASHVGGIPEISRHRGCKLVPPGDPRSLAEAIAAALREPHTPTAASLPEPSWDTSARSLASVLSSIARDEVPNRVDGCGAPLSPPIFGGDVMQTGATPTLS